MWRQDSRVDATVLIIQNWSVSVVRTLVLPWKNNTSDIILVRRNRRKRAFRLLGFTVQWSEFTIITPFPSQKTVIMAFHLTEHSWISSSLEISYEAIPSTAAWILVRNGGPSFHPSWQSATGIPQFLGCFGVKDQWWSPFLSLCMHPSAFATPRTRTDLGITKLLNIAITLTLPTDRMGHKSYAGKRRTPRISSSTRRMLSGINAAYVRALRALSRSATLPVWAALVRLTHRLTQGS